MTSESTAWAWKQKLKPSEKLVLLALAERAGGYQHEVALNESIHHLVERTCLSRRGVQRSLRALEDAGFVVAEERVDAGGKRLANRWHLNVDGLAPVSLPIPTVWNEQ